MKRYFQRAIHPSGQLLGAGRAASGEGSVRSQQYSTASSFPTCPEAPLSQSDPKNPGNNPKCHSRGCQRCSSKPVSGVFRTEHSPTSTGIPRMSFLRAASGMIHTSSSASSPLTSYGTMMQEEFHARPSTNYCIFNK